jgi:threonine/homoserine/homoserine lactone efflux protein
LAIAMNDVLPIWAFIAVTVPLVLTPGASTAVVLRNSIAGGTRAGLVTAAGVNTGSFCYGLLTAFGFALALRRWPSAWTLLRTGGLLYLAWLGVQSLVRARHRRPGVAVADVTAGPRSAWRPLYEGFVTNALNPSIATFYLVLVPQFIPQGAPVARSALVLTGLHIALAASWHAVWAAAGGTMAHLLASGRPRQVLEALSGLALLALAVAIALG